MMINITIQIAKMAGETRFASGYKNNTKKQRSRKLQVMHLVSNEEKTASYF